MQEIQIDNDLNLKTYINGIPDLSLMPKEVLDELCAAIIALIEEEMSKK